MGWGVKVHLQQCCRLKLRVQNDTPNNSFNPECIENLRTRNFEKDKYKVLTLMLTCMGRCSVPASACPCSQRGARCSGLGLSPCPPGCPAPGWGWDSPRLPDSALPPLQSPHSLWPPREPLAHATPWQFCTQNGVSPHVGSRGANRRAAAGNQQCLSCRCASCLYMTPGLVSLLLL